MVAQRRRVRQRSYALAKLEPNQLNFELLCIEGAHRGLRDQQDEVETEQTMLWSMTMEPVARTSKHVGVPAYPVW